jgi:hypothetical protein
MAAVMIGVDPHKASHTAVVIGAAEEPLGELRVRACAAQAGRPSADSIRVHPDSPAAASRITSRAALPPGHHARLTQRPRRGVSAPGGALTPSLRLTERTGPWLKP